MVWRIQKVSYDMDLSAKMFDYRHTPTLLVLKGK